MVWVSIDRTLATPLFRQIYEQLRTKILNGELQAGSPLPSTRELASHLQVARNVVLEAYEQLLAEGFLEGRQGSGTYVAEGAFLQTVERKAHSLLPDPIALEVHDGFDAQPDRIDFRSGIPALDLFPRKIWGQLAYRVFQEIPDPAFGYNRPEGRPELRTVLSGYLYRTRGVRCHPDQIVITSGATQALTLVAKLLLGPDQCVITEDPVTQEIQTIFSTPGARLHGVAVDESGLRTDLLPANKNPCFVYVTPSHQFPLGGTMSIQRRVQLIQYARSEDCFIVEDDYDSEFRYKGPPVSSLQGLEPERVIYIGTFSKNLSPALRLGYLLLPPDLIELCRKLKRFSDLHTPILEQLVLARFIQEGHLERHIARMKKIYRKRRNILVQKLYDRFGSEIAVSGTSTGLHLIVEFPLLDTIEGLVKQAEQAGIRVYPAEHHSIQKGVHANKLILGYGNLDEAEIEEGIKRLHTAWGCL
ncbi:PLP-dependent aminotransferase family protein [Effusibacillus lacus]|uniref:GntR family transcriptional regulator n=1 Tax=Effusibacillus lacus TaxID=1348429 RepID=A0A292YH90_9BACL|nr:PLP-dependent aminotransferase family protein [Effusibacillus lacus]TCS75535.1 GntR family transcriptional regulator [Effusibacillus lacus]GAX88998.1 GntR family transcriptional regulator [Effusibacillus lacus]